MSLKPIAVNRKHDDACSYSFASCKVSPDQKFFPRVVPYGWTKKEVETEPFVVLEPGPPHNLPAGKISKDVRIVQVHLGADDYVEIHLSEEGPHYAGDSLTQKDRHTTGQAGFGAHSYGKPWCEYSATEQRVLITQVAHRQIALRQRGIVEGKSSFRQECFVGNFPL
eukprot:gnl/TRDRNA2_/TRDRNA2_129560_c0_seq1.p1 gnl/TRDRNA2_/TRDRNA2_129560_c0~~gnl/TRDRNA2_/TRDRNA2_129560_c0_seq1.p1  ORF type:complete len:167 (+),score=17.74 gnl/TRDRNA2_/TRDRNA2_129560_c0_seq1:38-538(+)